MLKIFVQVQLSALSTLPRLPAYKLSSALLEGEIGPRLEPCLESSSKEVGASIFLDSSDNSITRTRGDSWQALYTCGNNTLQKSSFKVIMPFG